MVPFSTLVIKQMEPKKAMMRLLPSIYKSSIIRLHTWQS
jgi:hypothetical protein